LASKKDYIVAQIDGRGSGGKGWDYQHQVYYSLGHLEAEDQIEVTKYAVVDVKYYIIVCP
jgi:dipeptidyl-peptidase-4